MKLIRSVMALVDAGTRGRIIASGCCSLALALLDLCAVLLVFPLIQMLVTPKASGVELGLGLRLGSDGTMNTAAVLAGIVVALFALKNILAIVFLRWNLGFVLSAETSVATRLFAGRLDVASATSGAIDTAALQRTLNESLRKVFTEGLAFALPAIADQLVIVLLSALVLLIAPVEAVVAVLTFSLAAVGYRKAIHGRTGAASTALHADQRLVYAISTESLRASREIALLQAQPHFVREYEELRRRVSNSQRTISLSEQLPRSFLELCLLFCTATVAAVAFNRHDTASALALVGTFAAVGFRVLPSLNRVLLAAARSRSALPSLDQIEQDLSESQPLPRTERVPRSADKVARVDVRGLTVRVPGRHAPLLAEVDLELRRGEIVGILGASGAGKTSLVNALLGFVPATRGSITLNGEAEVTSPESWLGRAAVVPQDVVILDASLRENVAFGLGRDKIDDVRVLTALRKAHLDNLLAELPEGTETVLGESGARMSGGQRQRLGIARALYHDADVLVLDESTAGLDFETEQRILSTLSELRRDRIVILVSHHRPVMEFCDRLVVLDEGRIVGTGPIEQLQILLDEAGLTSERNAAPRPLPSASR